MIHGHVPHSPARWLCAEQTCRMNEAELCKYAARSCEGKIYLVCTAKRLCRAQHSWNTSQREWMIHRSKVVSTRVHWSCSASRLSTLAGTHL